MGVELTHGWVGMKQPNWDIRTRSQCTLNLYRVLLQRNTELPIIPFNNKDAVPAAPANISKSDGPPSLRSPNNPLANAPAETRSSAAAHSGLTAHEGIWSRGLSGDKLEILDACSDTVVGPLSSVVLPHHPYLLNRTLTGQEEDEPRRSPLGRRPRRKWRI